MWEDYIADVEKIRNDELLMAAKEGEKKEKELNDKKIKDNDDDDTLPLDSKKGWQSYNGYYYDEDTGLHYPYSSWEDISLKSGEVILHF